jgi:hypothetical protein
VHLLHEEGIQKALFLARIFSDALDGIEKIAGSDGRDMAIVRTKLEEASFYAKRAVAVRPENQEKLATIEAPGSHGLSLR